MYDRGVERFSPTLARLAVRTPTPPPATHTNCYAIGARDVLLVEPAPGDPGEQAAFLAWVSALKQEGRRPVGLFVTHHHPDHIGGLVHLADTLALPVFFHEETRRRTPEVAAWRLLDDGDRVVLDGPEPITLDVLHTPGHAAGHLCLHDARNGDLVCGDMVASEGTIVITPEDGNMGEYLRQLERLDRLDAAFAHPAHGGPIPREASVFKRFIAHRLAREEKVFTSLARFAEGATNEALLPVAYDDVFGTAAEPILFFAERSLESHLIKLEEDGRISRKEGRSFVRAHP